MKRRCVDTHALFIASSVDGRLGCVRGGETLPLARLWVGGGESHPGAEGPGVRRRERRRLELSAPGQSPPSAPWPLPPGRGVWAQRRPDWGGGRVHCPPPSVYRGQVCAWVAPGLPPPRGFLVTSTGQELSFHREAAEPAPGRGWWARPASGWPEECWPTPGPQCPGHGASRVPSSAPQERQPGGGHGRLSQSRKSVRNSPGHTGLREARDLSMSTRAGRRTCPGPGRFRVQRSSGRHSVPASKGA